MAGQDQRELLTDILKAVSRSFYLTLQFLPQSVRPQIGLAYLLARTSDTIADTDLIPAPARIAALNAFGDAVANDAAAAPAFREFATAQSAPEERIILERCDESIRLLRAQTTADRARIRRVLEIIISGQALDLQRFANASEQQIVALQSATELDDYTYRVAGCVGEFWTEMCLAHALKRFHPPADFHTNSQRFGKGLQLVNILRDMPKDLRAGRCYLPADELQAAGLRPSDLLNPTNESRVRLVYDHWLTRCVDHLNAGWNYTCAIPASAMRLRIGCALPLLIGVETARALKRGNFLDPAQRMKVSRAEVKRLMTRAIFLYPLQRRWKRLFRAE